MVWINVFILALLMRACLSNAAMVEAAEMLVLELSQLRRSPKTLNTHQGGAV
jgi:hypothetical protein